MSLKLELGTWNSQYLVLESSNLGTWVFQPWYLNWQLRLDTSIWVVELGYLDLGSWAQVAFRGLSISNSVTTPWYSWAGMIELLPGVRASSHRAGYLEAQTVRTRPRQLWHSHSDAQVKYCKSLLALGVSSRELMRIFSRVFMTYL